MATWDQVMDAINLTLGGDRTGGREQMLRCWSETAADDHAMRCVLAHYLADLEPDLAEEVAWDERALAAFDDVGPSDLIPIGISDARVLSPSLHLNLGDGYVRQGRIDDAREQLIAGLADAAVLPDHGVGAMASRGLVRLQRRLDSVKPPSPT